jgi:hypothetical protein
VEPSAGFEPVPAGKYLAVITESELKGMKAGTGQYLQLTFEVLEGDYKGRHLWARLNLVNPSDKAVKIARAELSAVCRAVGVLAPSDSTDLHDLPLVLQVKCRKREDTGEVTNEIAAYHKRDASPPPANGQAAPAAAQANATPPWKRA